MDRNAALPERCVVCNEAASKWVGRTLYWSPAPWRVFCWVAPVALLVVGSTLRIPLLLVSFWPTVIVLGIASYVIRKKVKLELGACERHYNLRTLLQVLSIVTFLAALLVFGRLLSAESSMTLLAIVIVAAAGLAFAQRLLGVQKVSLSRLDPDHAWLAGTGKAFRDALPEPPA
jgi:hypothetical protein